MPLADSLLPEARAARRSEVDRFMDIKNNWEELQAVATFLSTEANKLQRKAEFVVKLNSYIGFIASGALLSKDASDLEVYQGTALAAHYFIPLIYRNDFADVKYLIETYKYPDVPEATEAECNTTLNEDDAYDMLYVVIENIRMRMSVGSSSEN